MAEEVQLSTLGAVIKTAYEGQANTNAFTDAEKSKLASTSVFTDAEKTKLAGIQAGAQVNSVLTVNDIAPDSSGNITIPTGGGDVLSVNGITPDSSGDITLPVGDVLSVNGITPDSSGDVTLPVGDVVSVNGVAADSSGDVTLTKGNIGLGNVDNTSDVNKPVSTATQTAINTAVEDMVISDPTGVIGADVVSNIMSLTQSEYDAIVSPDASTLYVIVG